jgi:hypothetical protein
MRLFSPVSYKDSFRIIMALLAQYSYMQLHQMDVKTAFLNGDLYENVYMAQPKGFVVEGKKKHRVPPEKVDLWIEASLKAVVFEI